MYTYYIYVPKWLGLGKKTIFAPLITIIDAIVQTLDFALDPIW